MSVDVALVRPNPAAWPVPRSTVEHTPAVPPRPVHRHAHTVAMFLPVRIFLAAGWLRAGAEKLIEPTWWDGTVLRKFLTQQHATAVPFFRPVMDHVIAPAAVLVAVTVVVLQLMCGVFIATGRFIRFGLRAAFVMNVAFVLAGRVNPSAFYLVMEVVLLFAIADGALGVTATKPSSRSFVAAGVSVALAAVFIPYIRTLEPAKVIEDPAMMLTFVGVILATTFVVRRAAHVEFADSRLGRLWGNRMAGWVHAQPRGHLSIDSRPSDVRVAEPTS